MFRLRILAALAALAWLAPASAQTAALTASPTSLNSAGGQLTLTLNASYTGTAIFGCEVILPSGWSYVSGSGEPSLKPTAGNVSPLDWLTTSYVATPVQFSFTLAYPAGVTAASVTSAVTLDQTVQVTVKDKTTGAETTTSTVVRTNLTPSPVTFGTTVTIVGQPANQTATVGGSAAFNVTVTGSAPFTYQWRKDNVPISGATAAALTLSNIQTTAAGNYTVTVSNPISTATSSAATLTVSTSSSGGGGGGGGGIVGGGGGGVIGGGGGGTTGTAPAIAAQPNSLSIAAGGAASFSVTATGTTPLTYQWQKNGAAISGATGATLTISNVQSSDAGGYSVVVTNSAGTATSSAATLTVTSAAPAVSPTPPAIIAQPPNATFTAGASVSVGVIATGAAPLTYQWRKNGVAISGATGASLTIANAQPADTGNYTVVVTNSVGAVTSSAASLVVNPAATAPTITTQPANLTALAAANVSFTVAASGTPPLSYQWRKNGAAIAGATSATLSLVNLSADDAASYSVVVTNASGSATSNAAALTLATAAVAPSISVQPLSQSATLGASAAFSVGADGTAPFTYQWRKNGALLAGATGATLTLANLRVTDAGSYSVAITNSVGTTTSGTATLTVTPPTGAPAILAEPADLVARAGAHATFTVNAAGTAPLAYEWRKNGATIATGAALTLNNVQSADAAVYTVVVTNALGTATSRAATLTIRGRSYAGTYFGSFGNGGSFAITIRDDNTGVFLGYAAGSATAIVSRSFTVDDTGHFSFASTASNAPVLSLSNGSAPNIAAAASDFSFSGTIGADGTLSGSVSGGANTTLAATRAADTGAAQSVAGFYQAGATGASATTYSIVSPSGQAFVLAVTPTATVAGSGTVDSAGKISVATATNGTVTGTLSAASSTLTASVTPTGGAKIDFTGASDTRLTTEKLINIATRGPVGGSAGALIAGFVVSGDAPKQVLVRAIGPTLGAFGVSGALSAARLEIFDNKQSSIATSTAWGAASNATDIAAAAVRAGAFALDPSSKDAVLLVTLEPGAYTAIVSGDGGASGVALVEVYDVSENATVAQKVVNIASRAFAGSGDNTLTAGFVISGTVPKRVLIRGAGPALAAFGVPGVLADPQVKLLMQSGTVVATNDNWGDTADAAAIASAAGSVGAFAFNAGSKDAALLINLTPGPYTVQLTGAGTATGSALIEVYEVP